MPELARRRMVSSLSTGRMFDSRTSISVMMMIAQAAIEASTSRMVKKSNDCVKSDQMETSAPGSGTGVAGAFPAWRANAAAANSSTIVVATGTARVKGESRAARDGERVIVIGMVGILRIGHRAAGERVRTVQTDRGGWGSRCVPGGRTRSLPEHPWPGLEWGDEDA